MSVIITLQNNKGGSAKTTSVTTIGHGLVRIMKANNFSNSKVLIVDTDSQAHSTLLLTGHKDYDIKKTLYGVLDNYRTTKTVNDYRGSIVKSTWDDNLHLLPATMRLEEMEDAMIGMDGNVFALRRILNEVRDDYQVILIDTCPKFSLLTKMALLASEQVMIPVAPSSLDADGLVSLIQRVQDIRQDWGQSNPDVTGVIVVKFSKKVTGHNNIRDAIKNGTLKDLYLGTVPINASMEYSHEERVSIFDYKNGNTTSAHAYNEIVKQIALNLFQPA